MFNYLYSHLEPHATLAMCLILVSIWVVCVIGFEFRTKHFGVKALDGRVYDFDNKKFLYTLNDADSLFRHLKQTKSNLFGDNLKLYGITELTLDLVFPIVYVLLFAFLIINLFSEQNAKYLILIPILTGLFDLLENSTIAFSAFTFNEGYLPLYYLAVVATGTKATLFLLSFVVVIFGVIGVVAGKTFFSSE